MAVPGETSPPPAGDHALERAEAHFLRGEQETAVELAAHALAMSLARGDPGLRVAAHLQIARAYHALGRFPTTLEHVRTAIDVIEDELTPTRASPSARPHPAVTVDPEGPRPVDGLDRGSSSGWSAGAAWPEDALASACALGAEGLAELGDATGALTLLQRAERAAGKTHPARKPIVLAEARAHVHVLGGEAAAALALLGPAVAAGRALRLGHPLARVLTALARSLALAGQATEGIEVARQAIRLHEDTGTLVHCSSAHLALAAACAAAGRLDAAERAAGWALDLSERHGERAWEAWTRFTMGEIARRRDDRREAEQRWDEAQEIAEELALRPLVERCRAGLRALG